MRALFFALEFPPLSTTGVHRSAKLCKYLPELGIEPIVITLNEDDASKSFEVPLEPSLMDELPRGLSIYAVSAPVGSAPSTRLGEFLRIWGHAEDSFADRIRPALMKMLPAIVARHAPSVVYVSMPPFSTGRLAADIARELRLPLVVDMRDGWSHWCAVPFPTYAHWVIVHARERKLFEQAAAIVTVTEQLADVFRGSHPHIPARRFQVVSNGYDGSLVVPESFEVVQTSADSLVTVGYVGGFYYTPESRASAFTPWWRRARHRKLNYVPVREDYLYRSPHYFFRTLRELKRRDPALGARVRFALIGEKPRWLDAMAAEHGVENAVHCYGRVPNARVLELAQSLDALLCTSTKVEGGQDYALTSKTFDYVRAGRPILGLVTPGSQKDFLERSGLAVVADPDDLDASVDALARIARGGFTLRPDRPFLATYHRRALAERMAEVLRTASSPDGASRDQPLGRPLGMTT